ncbi:hypothetical protein NP233_g3688 [Leucocoprinus birnbaumii]|uniref:Annexin n=1 Tax=Leucocoprinus birnbaumii TaxID=56174 RepID=A0AAD5VWK2_9AGAR|nr:hypothetical protein NP233_g3688 [Leucocoprinus birnbaumii]
MASEGYQQHPLTPSQPEPQVSQSPGGFISPSGSAPAGSPQVQIPGAAPIFPAAGGPSFPNANAQSGYQPAYYPQPPTAITYLGAAVPNPEAPPATHGVQKVAGYDPQQDYEIIKRAKKSGVFGTSWNEDTLIKVLGERSIFELDALSDHFGSKLAQTLADFLPSKGKVSSWFNEVVHALALGPVGYDVELARRATQGFGTKETLLKELLLNRSNSEIETLKRAYNKRYGLSLEKEVREDLSGTVQTLYVMALRGQRPQELPGQVNFAQVEQDVDGLFSNGLGKNAKFDEEYFCEVFINRSDPHITAVIDRYGAKYKGLSKSIKNISSLYVPLLISILVVVLNKEVKAGLVYIIHSVKSKRNMHETQGAWQAAKYLHAAMTGKGTRDEQLVYRLIRASWNPEMMRAVKLAYRQRQGEDLDARVIDETSGSYQKLLVKLIRRA